MQVKKQVCLLYKPENEEVSLLFKAQIRKKGQLRAKDL